MLIVSGKAIYRGSIPPAASSVSFKRSQQTTKLSGLAGFLLFKVTRQGLLIYRHF
jgi:hypothetical protein